MANQKAECLWTASYPAIASMPQTRNLALIARVISDEIHPLLRLHTPGWTRIPSRALQQAWLSLLSLKTHDQTSFAELSSQETKAEKKFRSTFSVNQSVVNLPNIPVHAPAHTLIAPSAVAGQHVTHLIESALGATILHTRG